MILRSLHVCSSLTFGMLMGGKPAMSSSVVDAFIVGVRRDGVAY
jgi:hypothetical protein